MLVLENHVAIYSTNAIYLKLLPLGVAAIQSTVSYFYGHEIFLKIQM